MPRCIVFGGIPSANMTVTDGFKLSEVQRLIDAQAAETNNTGTCNNSSFHEGHAKTNMNNSSVKESEPLKLGDFKNNLERYQTIKNTCNSMGIQVDDKTDMNEVLRHLKEFNMAVSNIAAGANKKHGSRPERNKEVDPVADMIAAGGNQHRGNGSNESDSAADMIARSANALRGLR